MAPSDRRPRDTSRWDELPIVAARREGVRANIDRPDPVGSCFCAAMRSWHYWLSLGIAFTISIVSRLTVTTWPMRRKIYSSSSARLGSLVISPAASRSTRYWSITQSSALRLPRRTLCAGSGLRTRTCGPAESANSRGHGRTPPSDSRGRTGGVRFEPGRVEFGANPRREVAAARFGARICLDVPGCRGLQVCINCT